MASVGFLGAACAAAPERAATDVDIPAVSATPSVRAGTDDPTPLVRHASPHVDPGGASTATPLPPRSQNPNAVAAEALFDEGKRLFSQGRFGEACGKFEASASLDPAAGTFLNLAKCREQLGDVGSACAALRNAASLVTPGDARSQLVRQWGMRLGCGLP